MSKIIDMTEVIRICRLAASDARAEGRDNAAEAIDQLCDSAERAYVQTDGRTVSVDKAALGELMECVEIAITDARTNNNPEFVEKFEEALRNIECEDAFDRVLTLRDRLSTDKNYHDRDIEALGAVLEAAEKVLR